MNDEARSPKPAASAKGRIVWLGLQPIRRRRGFVIRHSFVIHSSFIRHSSFVIHHSSFVIHHSVPPGVASRACATTAQPRRRRAILARRPGPKPRQTALSCWHDTSGAFSGRTAGWQPDMTVTTKKTQIVENDYEKMEHSFDDGHSGHSLVSGRRQPVGAE